MLENDFICNIATVRFLKFLTTLRSISQETYSPLSTKLADGLPIDIARMLGF